MTDMLVKLYDHPMTDKKPVLKEQGIDIRRALGFDSETICAFVGEHFKDICPQWVNEARVALMRQPSSCFIAVAEKKIIGLLLL